MKKGEKTRGERVGVKVGQIQTGVNQGVSREKDIEAEAVLR